MATHKFTLTHGLKVGEERLKACVMRQVETGDIIDAQLESERVEMVDMGGRLMPVLLESPVAMGLNTLRRQIISVGDMSGPFDLAELRKLHVDDFQHIQLIGEMLDGVMTAKEVAEELASRGRSDSAGGDAGGYSDKADPDGHEA